MISFSSLRCPVERTCTTNTLYGLNKTRPHRWRRKESMDA
nr:MAG TPA: hypothetical protein [Caudoviricetes sp.]